MDDLKLGKCCICEQENESVRNMITLHKEIPAEEKNGGWGCFVCDRPARGAVAVLCDVCLEKNFANDFIFDAGEREDQIKFACLGYPGENRRIEIEKLTVDFDHDMTKHSEENRMGYLSVEADFGINGDCGGEHCGVIGCPSCDREYYENYSECGKLTDGSCLKAGSEECDWECPYSN